MRKKRIKKKRSVIGSMPDDLNKPKRGRNLDIPGAKTDKVVKLADLFWAKIMKLTENDSHLGWMAISRLQNLHVELKIKESKEKEAGLISDGQTNQSPGA